MTTPLTISPDAIASRHVAALRDLIRGDVRVGAHDRMLYATDASLYQVEPLAVVIPADDEDAIAAFRYCAEHDLPILPRGGGTSLAGQCVNRAVVIDVSAHCHELISVDPARRTCVVEPGITIDDLNDQLAALGHDLFFAPDPATARHCNVGGAIGNNAAGTRSILYGRTAENLESVNVVLTTGERARLGPGSGPRDLASGVIDVCTRYERLIRERFPKTLRRNAGYALDMILADIGRARAGGADAADRINLAHLVCGSEGTLAFITGATLKLHPRPKAKGLGVLGFPTLDEAIDAVEHCLTLGPAAVELLDDLVVGLARENTEYRRYADLMPQPGSGALAAVLYVEFFSTKEGADGAREIGDKLERLADLMRRVSPRAACAPLTNPGEIAQALKLRKAGEPLLHALPGARKPIGFVEDNAVPPERLAEYVREFRRILAENGTRGAFYAHASVGVLHVRPLLDPRDPADRARMERIAIEVADLAKRLGGVMSGEHGDGRARGPLLERFFGPELMAAFREVKALFDPKGLMNPGNIVAPGPIESIHETLRVRPNGQNIAQPKIDAYFEYPTEGDFDHAAELCNGSGVCRKKEGGGGGTMCPSYRATLDERHSTRGRGNALRLAISGQLGSAAPMWNDPGTLETLDLCLSCKACKTECPTNVDMARYKAEYLAQSYRASGGAPADVRTIANVRALNRLGSRFAPLSNWVANLAPIRAITNTRLGLAPARSLPPFRPSIFRRIGGRSSARVDGLSDAAPTVLLFADCFSAYNEPEIAQAAIETLNAFGYRVHVPDLGCCARPSISLGLLDEARTTIESTFAKLADAVARHRARGVLFLEPSCLSAVTDDWLHLKLGISGEARRAIADQCLLAEGFLERDWDAHPARPSVTVPAKGGGGRLVLHAHCHQKALWGAETSARILQRLFGADVTVLDSGCCGMAGAFGMSAHRYDVSMRIGELALFPAARALAPEDTLVAPGTSCRHQIHDGVRMRALHPMQVIRAGVAPSAGVR